MDAPNITRGEKKKLKGKVSASLQEQTDMATSRADNAVLIAELTEVISTLMDDKQKKITDKLTIVVAQNEQRLQLAEERISTVEDSVKILQTKVAVMETQLKTANDKVIDLESRSRRDNLKILNLKEGIEGTDPKIFLESMLPKLLDLQTGKDRVKIDRAHRVGPKQDDRPRAMIIKLHNPSDKDKIMRAVKAKGSLMFENKKLFIYQDLSPAVREQRRGFNEVCEALIKKNIRFNMKFPAILCLSHGGNRYSFRSPAEAREYLTILKD